MLQSSPLPFICSYGWKFPTANQKSSPSTPTSNGLLRGSLFSHRERCLEGGKPNSVLLLFFSLFYLYPKVSPSFLPPPPPRCLQECENAMFYSLILMYMLGGGTTRHLAQGSSKPGAGATTDNTYRRAVCNSVYP